MQVCNHALSSGPGQLLDGMAEMALLGGRAGQGMDDDVRLICGSKSLQRASVPYAALQISCLAASGLVGTEHNNDCLGTFPAEFSGRRNRLEDSSTDQADWQCSPFGTCRRQSGKHAGLETSTSVDHRVTSQQRA